MDHTHLIKKFIVTEFLTDVAADELPSDYDLLANGVIDSLGLLKVVAWLEQEFRVEVGDLDISPDNFRTVAAIQSFIAASAGAPERVPALYA
jgi:acyl carrier protein